MQEHQPKLVGKLNYKLDLPPESSDWSSSKRKRPLQEVDDNHHATGLYFVPNCDDDPNNYLIILPQHLQKKACDAVRRHDTLVTLLSYTKRNHQHHVIILEVHDFMVQFKDCSVPVLNPTCSISTLGQVLQQELDTNKTKLKYTSFRATVDSISPIIALVPSDPFCFMEVMPSEHQTTLSCVVVLKGCHALSCHAAIQPGQNIVLVNIKRVKWTVRKEVSTRLQHRIPQYVFVATSSDCIQWDDIDTPPAHQQSLLLPSTPVPLIALEGTITHVDNDTITIKPARINTSSDVSPTFIILHLSHFPMSTELQLGMREGAILRAVNVHDMWTTTHHIKHVGACLRSTLCLIQLSSNEPVHQQHPSELHRPPYQYRQVRSTYFAQMFKSYLSEWNLTGTQQHVTSTVVQLLRYGGLESTNLRPFIESDDHVTANAKKRNPYEEFFSHAMEEHSTAMQQCHCSSSVCQSPMLHFPMTQSLADIKTVCHDLLHNHLIQIFMGESTHVKGGWTTGIQLSAEEISTKSKFIILFGTIQSVDKNQQPTSFADANMQLPLSVYSNKAVSSVGDFCALDLHSVVASCLCLGTVSDDQKEVNGGVRSARVDLMPYNLLGEKHVQKQKIVGSCTLFQMRGFVFMTSLLVHCSHVAHIHGKVRQSPESTELPLSIQQCLQPQARNTTQGRFVGLLSRQRFKFAKIRKGLFNACTLTLSQAPLHGPFSADDISSLQSLELKLSFSISKEAWQEMLRVRSLLGVNLLEEQIALAAAWWHVADSGNTAPLMAAGLDELILPPNRVGLVPRLSVPMSALEQGGHGYVRFKCNSEKIYATLERIETLSSPRKSNTQEGFVTSMGGYKFLPGMLDRRPTRCGGALVTTPRHSGVPNQTLAELHWKLCKDIRNSTKFELEPSMVQCIRNSKLLSISFCRAQVECTQCFQHLVFRRDDNNRVVSDIVDCKPSFWDWPLPNENNKETFMKPRVSLLRCPNDCPPDAHVVRWECSGVLDDGTGQAKLYAERDAAVLLLGMDDDTCKRIAEGAWYTNVGIVFSRASPPKASCCQTIRKAQHIAVATHGRHVTEEHVLRLVTPLVRAEYLLQQHCRVSTSSSKLRPLDYFVRCKPIGGFHLQQTEIDMVTPGVHETQSAIVAPTSTYSLPPLKLSLVDCVSVRNEVRESSWTLLRMMKGA